jgi:hypothetical protein
MGSSAIDGRATLTVMVVGSHRKRLRKLPDFRRSRISWVALNMDAIDSMEPVQGSQTFFFLKKRFDAIAISGRAAFQRHDQKSGFLPENLFFVDRETGYAYKCGTRRVLVYQVRGA